MSRKPDFDLASALANPGFTPGAKDAPALVDLVAGADEKIAARAAPALASLGEAGRRAIAQRLDANSEGSLDDAGWARLVGVLGLLARAGDALARAMVVAATSHATSRVRRAAATALGKLASTDDKPGDAELAARRDALAALLARWDASDVTPDERRVLVEALGKIGGEAAIDRIRALDPGDDAELARRRDRALLMADRSSKRGDESSVVANHPPPHPVRVVLECKSGLASLLVEDLASIGLAATANVDFEVELELAQPLEVLFGSHLWSGVAIRVPLAAGAELADRVVTTILGSVRGLIATWTRGPIRWRLGFASGHKRAVVWRVARDVTAAAPELVNDPTATTWDLLVDEGAATLDIVPKRLVDPRFAWRVAEVPAASQPSVAAALVWVAGLRDDDRVWDPFCGSGLELVERARRGRFARLVGTDIDEAALVAARANADAAAAHVELVRGDARTFSAGEIDCAITNPPLGSRVHVDAAQLLVETVPNIARQLAPGGRLVWITPALKKTTSACERAKLVRTRSLYVDLGGVRGHLERWEKR